MTLLARPRAKRAEQISQQDHDTHYWLGRLAMCLATTSHEMPPHLKKHVRKTLDEFAASGAASGTLARIVKEETTR